MDSLHPNGQGEVEGIPAAGLPCDGRFAMGIRRLEKGRMPVAPLDEPESAFEVIRTQEAKHHDNLGKMDKQDSAVGGGQDFWAQVLDWSGLNAEKPNQGAQSAVDTTVTIGMTGARWVLRATTLTIRYTARRALKRARRQDCR